MTLDLRNPPLEAAHLVPVLQLVEDEAAVVALVKVGAGGWVLLLGDDRDHSEGAGAFTLAAHFVRRATHTAVMSGARVAEIHAAAARLAGEGRHVVLIETQLDQHAAWRKWVRAQAPDAAYGDVLVRPGDWH